MASLARVCSCLALTLTASCSRAPQPPSTPSAEPVRPLAVYAEQRVVLAPTTRIRVADTSRWVRELGSARTIGTLLDGQIVGTLRDRGLAGRWTLPADLLAAYERNRAYAANPYQLAVEQLRPATFVAGSKYGEPLSSQLRTMIALHEDARIVLIPVELQLEGRQAVLRLVLVDPRFAEARFVGELRSEGALPTSAAALTQLAQRVVDLFVAP